MVVDYSKWDKMQFSSSEDEGDDLQVEKIDTFEDGSVSLQRQDGRRPGQPTVTKFTKPQTVHLEKNKTPSESVQTTPSESVQKRRPIRAPEAGSIVEGDYAWEQTSFSVTYWVDLPKFAELNKRKEVRSITFIKEKPPKEKFEGRDIPYAFAASSFEGADADAEDDDKLFPTAWGILVKWPVSSVESQANWKVDSLIAEREFLFPYPVSSTEEAWGWQLTDECPLLEPKKRLNIEVTKKRSTMLGGVSIWWDKAFLGAPKIQVNRPQSESSAAFQKAWKEAHQMFKEKMKHYRKVEI